MTETAWLADVVLPATRLAGEDRHRDQHRPHGAARPPGARPAGRRAPDLWIIQQIAQRMGLRWNYPGEDSGVAAVYEEMRQAMHDAIAGITWERLEREGSVTYPCLTEDDPGPADRVHRPLPDRRRPRASWCRPTSSRPTNGPMPSIRSC